MKASGLCTDFASGKLCSDSPDFPPNLNRIDRLGRGVCVLHQTILGPRSSPEPLKDIPVDCITFLLSSYNESLQSMTTVFISDLKGRWYKIEKIRVQLE